MTSLFRRDPKTEAERAVAAEADVAAMEEDVEDNSVEGVAETDEDGGKSDVDAAKVSVSAEAATAPDDVASSQFSDADPASRHRANRQ